MEVIKIRSEEKLEKMALFWKIYMVASLCVVGLGSLVFALAIGKSFYVTLVGLFLVVYGFGMFGMGAVADAEVETKFYLVRLLKGGKR